MQQLTILFCLLLISLLTACSNNNATTETTQTDSTSVITEEPTPVVPQPDESTLEGFWGIFQEAVQKEDKAKLVSLTSIAEDDDNLDMDFYDGLFFKIGKEQIAKMTPQNFINDRFQGEDILKFEVDLSDKNGVNGLIFHVNLKDGKYCIGRIRVAGGAL